MVKNNIKDELLTKLVQKQIKILYDEFAECITDKNTSLTIEFIKEVVDRHRRFVLLDEGTTDDVIKVILLTDNDRKGLSSITVKLDKTYRPLKLSRYIDVMIYGNIFEYEFKDIDINDLI